MQPQYPTYRVARDSRLHILGATALLIATGWPRDASGAPAADAASAIPQAREGASVEENEQAPTETRAPESSSYGLPLGLAYFLAPGLALAAGGGLFELTHSDTVSVVGGGLMFGLPAATHAYHAGAERSVISFGSMLGVTLGGVIGLGALGYFVGPLGCDENSDSDCEWVNQMTYMFGGAVIGGVVGYVGHAAYDVTSNSSVPAQSTGEALQGNTKVQLWLSPLMAKRQEGSSGLAAFDGLQLGMALSL